MNETCNTDLYNDFLNSPKGILRNCLVTKIQIFLTVFHHVLLNTLFPQVLKFLARRRKASSVWKQPKALSDEHRLSLQEKVNDYIKQHPVHLHTS